MPCTDQLLIFYHRLNASLKGIVVDDVFNVSAKPGDEAASPSLNPLFLFQLDRREHIKLFTKIMLYENMLVDQREAETN